MTDLVFEIFFYYTLFHVLKLCYKSWLVFGTHIFDAKYPDAYLTSTEMNRDHLRLIDRL